MDSFLFALVSVLLLSIGGKDQLMVARFSDRLGQSIGLLVTAILCCIASAAVMAFAGASIAALLPLPAQQMLIAIALLIASIEMFWPVRLPDQREPTRSLGAIGLVLVFRQLGDSARFAVFAFAAATVVAPLAGLGGALGGVAAVFIGWTMRGELEAKLPLRTIRITLGTALLIAAIWIALIAREIL